MFQFVSILPAPFKGESPDEKLNSYFDSWEKEKNVHSKMQLQLENHQVDFLRAAENWAPLGPPG